MQYYLSTVTRLATVVIFTLGQVLAASDTLEQMLANEDIRVAEDGVLGPDSQVGIDFVRAVVTQREFILSHLSTLAPDPPRQCKLMVASEFMTPHDYIAFLNGVCDTSKSVALSEQALVRMLVPRMAKHGFLASNYDQPQIRSVIEKLEVLAGKGSDTRWRQFFTELKSGQMKENVLARCAREGLPSPESYTLNSSEANRLAMGAVGAANPSSQSAHANATTKLSAPREGSTSSTPWTIVMVVIAAATSLLWLWLKRRAK